jgi:hypothetical protein
MLLVTLEPNTDSHAVMDIAEDILDILNSNTVTK